MQELSRIIIKMAEGIIRLVDLSLLDFSLSSCVSQVLQFQTDTLATVSMCGSSNSAPLVLIIDDST
jgi:hypothetical protein